MADANVAALYAWGQGLATAAAGAGMPMAALPASGEIDDFVGWARGVTSGVGGMIPLPALGDGAGYAEALAWAKVFDGTARGMGASLPPLPA